MVLLNGYYSILDLDLDFLKLKLVDDLIENLDKVDDLTEN